MHERGWSVYIYCVVWQCPEIILFVCINSYSILLSKKRIYSIFICRSTNSNDKQYLDIMKTIMTCQRGM